MDNISKFFAFCLRKCFGWEIIKRDVEKMNKHSPCIIVCNHQSSLDLITLMEVYPKRCSTLAKKELIWAGPFGLGSWLSGLIFIDRLNPEKARDTMTKTVRKITNENIKLLIFPEGTRHAGEMLPFKKGGFHLAVQAQIPIVPLVISSYELFCSKKPKRFDDGKVIVQALDPIPTVGMTAENVTELAETTRDKMAKVFEEINKELKQMVKKS
ncbi:unnamed protein product [Owenia fusiformis]|uniref:1-acyl-sn-glycerol-3-phosphate acyltransferase n=1 Tax=Owenia fusiformis TaxID=6347 RepID=A0A8J1XWI4_OWEFU|nr:unnamed protein product [Owenia fusiformis]